MNHPIIPNETGSMPDHDGDIAPRPRPPTSRRRDKPQLSCNLCRRRKTRCDRQKPCSNCSARGHRCVYAENKLSGLSSKSLTDEATLNDRLAHLESLVRTLESQDQSFQKPPSMACPTIAARVSTPADDESETGSMRISASDHQYVGGEHWAAILDSIADLRDHFDREEQFRLAETPDTSEQTAMNDDVDSENHKHRFGRALLLYGCRPASSRAEILSALPPKSTVDRYISRYFNQLDLVASSSVHGPTFLREYESFWENPSGPPIMWIGLLISMICLALIASESTESGNMTYTEQQCLQIELYREKVVQCLMMGEYTQGGRHSLETFMNYVYIEFRIHDDAEKDVWFLHGIEVNLAKRMGYHRDPKHFQSITPLDGEMRRRLWATVLLGDSLISGQMGMPLMITSDQFDTAEPRNLNDSDIDGEISSLPLPRPETENTTSLGLIARRRVLIALGVVADLTSSLKHSEYADYMKVDLVLNEAGRSVPPPLQMHSMASSVTDTPQTIMSRLFLRHIFTRGQIMLHRKFLFMTSPSTEEDIFAYSRETCTNAALETLQIQQILDEETSPGGQLQAMQWRVGSLMNHHFLTATMILCAMVHQKHTLGREEEIMRALRTARAIWMRRSQGSREAQRAAQAVSIILAKAGGPRFDIEIDLRGDNGFKGSSMTNELPIIGEDNQSFKDQRQFALSNSLPFDQGEGLDPELMDGNIIPRLSGEDTGLDFDFASRDSGLLDWILLNNGGF